MSRSGRFWRIFAACLALAGVSGLPDAEPEERPANFSRQHAQRAYPVRTIPPGAYARAMAHLGSEERRLRTLRRDWLGGMPAWTALGPAPVAQGQTFGNPRLPTSGRVSVIALDPRYDGAANQTVYIGAALGGVWRSRDNGATWTPLTDDQPSLAMGALAIDPTNPNIIYAGTGEAHWGADCYYGAGLLKSLDGGATWMQITGPLSRSEPGLPAFFNAAFHALVIDPSRPSTLYAATSEGAGASAVGFAFEPALGDRGIWKSIDGGLTWRNVNPANARLDRAGSDIVLDPRDPNRVYAALRKTGIYASSSSGEPGTWTKLTNGLPDSGFFRIQLAAGPPLPPSTASTFYAVFASTAGALLGIYRSTDDGGSWTRINGPPDRSQQLNYDLALAVDPTDARVVYYGTAVNSTNTGGSVWRTRDGGATWADLSLGNGVTGGLHADTHWIAISPSNRQVLFTASDGGVWRTENATADVPAWTNLNQSLNLTQFYTIALHPTDPDVLVGGTQDNGTVRHNGSLSWTLLRSGDGGAVLIDQSNPQVVYHTFFNVNNFGGARAQIGPEVSLNGGDTWTRRFCGGCSPQAGGFHPADRVASFAPMALHAGFTGPTGNVIYFGTHRLYRSADRAATWIGLGPSADGFGADLTKGVPQDESGFSFSFVSAIAGGPPGETVWVGTADGLVQVTENAGDLDRAAFVNVTRPPLPDRFVTDIAVDPARPGRAYVVYSGFGASTPGSPGHVFVTADLGATWRDISGNLPDTPVNSIAIDPLAPAVVYLGTDVGVFQTADGGRVWARLDRDIPNVPVFMLRRHAATRSLIAATHGRGVFRLRLPPLTESGGR